MLLRIATGSVSLSVPTKGAQLLQTTLTEESDTDKKLTKLVESVINVAAK